jgi:hypothetical protein
MPTGWELAGALVGGPLAGAAPWPFAAQALLCDLRSRFLPKGTVGAGHRAVARNGRVLLCSDRPLDTRAGRLVRVRLQTWHRAILPGDAPQPYGVLLCVRGAAPAPHLPLFATELRTPGEAELWLDLGGRLRLAFHRTA